MSTLSQLSAQSKLDSKSLLDRLKTSGLNPRFWLGLICILILALFITAPIYVHFHKQDTQNTPLPVLTDVQMASSTVGDKVDENYVDSLVDAKPTSAKSDSAAAQKFEVENPIKKETHSAPIQRSDEIRHDKSVSKEQPKMPEEQERNYGLSSFVDTKGTASSSKIPLGTTIRVKLTNGINSSDPQSKAIALVVDSSWPTLSGAKLIGTSYAIKSSDRVYVSFQTLLLNGREIGISAHAIDSSGRSGIAGNLQKSDYSKDVLNAVASGVAVFAKEMLSAKTGGYGSSAQQVVDKANNNSGIDTEKVITLDQGSTFSIFLDQGLSL